MAISVVKKNVEGKVPTWRGFIADTIADLALLPVSPAVAMGSECYCSEDGNTYILETDGDWVIKKGSSSGGGSSETLPAVTTEDNGQVLTVVEGEWNKAIPVQLADLVLHARNYYPDDAPDDSDPVFEVDMLPNDFLEFIEANPEATIVMILQDSVDYGTLLLPFNGDVFIDNHLSLFYDKLYVYQFRVACEEDETEVNYAWYFHSQHGYTNFTLEND